MPANSVTSRDASKLARLWRAHGGSVTNVRRTGEIRFTHPCFDAPLTVNGRRRDAPAKLISRLNQLLIRMPSKH